jgi:2-polyprenyl-3-methyl-5-hydroxy-6-metoxy-1,4-benzoquinol methylase
MRVQTVEGLFHRKQQEDDKATQPPALVTTGSAAHCKPEPLKQQKLVGAAANIAERFHHFRTSRNQRFFDALCNHFSSLQYDPCLAMYFEFATTSNERGQRVATLLQKHTRLQGKRYLDVGCAYAGFLVAFAERGAEVLGIDTDKMLINLAQYNLLDNHLNAPILVRDATCPEGLSEFQGSFDLITCNDVIEHVDDPQALLRNITAILRDDGIAYFEIPNRYHPRYVLQDGHYQLFGITLLDYPDASEYYSYHAPGVPYGVRHYLGLDEYAKLFEQVGMTFTVMDDTFENMDIAMILNDIAEVRAQKKIGLNRVPSVLRERVEDLLSRYLDDVEASPRTTASEQREFMLRYGVGFWRVLGHKTAFQPGLSQQSGQ